MWFYSGFRFSCRKKDIPVSNTVIPVIIIAILPGEPDLS